MRLFLLASEQATAEWRIGESDKSNAITLPFPHQRPHRKKLILRSLSYEWYCFRKHNGS